MELWLKHSSALTNADDTSSIVTGNTMNEVKEKLETDANWVLRFMASNGLVTNPAKITLMVLNYKSETKLVIFELLRESGGCWIILFKLGCYKVPI
jgi:hypothetical protein